MYIESNIANRQVYDIHIWECLGWVSEMRAVKVAGALSTHSHLVWLLNKGWLDVGAADAQCSHDAATMA